MFTAVQKRIKPHLQMFCNWIISPIISAIRNPQSAIRNHKSYFINRKS